MTKILQTNLGRMRAAHDLAYATAKHKGFDIIVISEPNKKIIEGNEWIKDKRKDVAVLFVNRMLEVTSVMVEEGYVVVRFEKWDLYCCYLSPNIGMDEYVEKADEVVNHIIARKREAIIAGDLNAKSHLWESTINDKKGEH